MGSGRRPGILSGRRPLRVERIHFISGGIHVQTHHHRPHHPDRGAPENRCGSERRPGFQGLVLGPDVAGHRDHPQGARSPGCLVLCPALLRRLHHGACHLGHPYRGERPERGSAPQRPVHPQYHDRPALGAGSHRSLLPPVRPGLGRYRVRPEGRPEKGLLHRPEPVRLARQQREGIQGGPGQAQGVRGQRPARHLRLRLLGPSGHEAAARGEPDRRGPLPEGPGLPAPGLPGRGHPRRQEPPHPEPGGGRGRHRREHGEHRHPQHGADRLSPHPDGGDPRLRPEGLLPGIW